MEIYASKEDIGNIRADLAGLEGRLRADIKEQAGLLKEHASDDRRELELVNNRVDAVRSTIDSASGGLVMLKWMIGVLLAMVTAGTIKLFVK